MQISRLNLTDSQDIKMYTKRSLLQLHMLFLGLFNEPYRSCLVDLGKCRLGECTSDPKHLHMMTDLESQCVSTAQQCARLVSLLQIDNLIRSHCWIALYVNHIMDTNQQALTKPIRLRHTSFTGCSILLFSASQKLLLLARDEISQDLSYASSHLNILSLCSYDSSTGRKLFTTLQMIFNDIREIVISPVYRAMCELHLVINDMALLSPLYYDEVDGAKDVCEDVLELAKRVINLLQDNMDF
jgi:hypothetical protein